MRKKDGNYLLKNLITIGIILNVFLFGILPLIYLSQYRFNDYDYHPWNILFGREYITEDIDPQYCRDSASYDAIIMIYEGLLAINLSHPEMALYPLLATDLGTYDVTGTKLTFNLKYGVRFHDGVPFNSTAVKWSFDRLAYLMNITGDLPGDCFYGTSTVVDSLYKWPDGTPIINHTEVVSNNVIKFVLNKPYGPFRALLTFPASFIMSPKSTPEDDYINPALAGVDPLGIIPNPVAGTGPMILENLDTYEVRFSAFEDYHRPQIDLNVLVHVLIQDSDTRNTAVIAGNIDIITDPSSEYLDTMNAEEEVTLYEAGCEAITYYMGFNNKQINITWRHAISYAINYSSVIDRLENHVSYTIYSRLKSPLPKGVLYANWSFRSPIFNITRAREIMQSMGFGVGWDATFPGNHEAQWMLANFRTLNYTYNVGNLYREGLFGVLEESLPLIGIKVEDAGMPWEDFKDRLRNRRVLSAGWDALQLYHNVWISDFNDPSTYLNPLYSNMSTYNTAQVNDPYLQVLLNQGLSETGPTREAIYDEIQRYLVEELRPHAWLYVEKNYDVWDKDLHGFPSNALDLAYFYPCYWN